MEIIYCEDMAQIIMSDAINRQDIESLYGGDVLVICVQNYFEYNQDTTLRILESPFFGTYSYIPNVGRLGITWQEGLGGIKEDYFISSFSLMRHIREVFDGFSPFDKLRLELDEVWECNLLRIEDKPMFAGIVRYYANAGNSLPHQDNPDSISGVIKQIAANIYLTSAEEGGELELWDMCLSQDAYNAIRVNYGVDKNAVKPPTIVLKPESGDLVLFDASNLHAVREVSGSTPRISQGVFCGLTEQNNLVLWS